MYIRKKNNLEISVVFVVLWSLFCTLIIKSILGLDSFSSTPIFNGFLYFGILLFVLLYFIKFDGKFFLKKSISYYFLIYVFLVIFSIFIGLFNQNSYLYIFSWSIYFLSSIIIYVFGYSIAYFDQSYKVKNNFLRFNLLFITAIVLLSVFFRNGIFYILTLSVLLFYIQIEKKLKYKVYFFVIFIIINYGFKNSEVILNLPRSGLIAILVGFFISLIYLRKYFQLIGLFMIIILTYLGVQIATQNMIEQIPNRSLKEGAYLLRGDSIDNHVATAQRFYEVEVVLNDFSKQGLLTQLAGFGFGKTIDMTQSDDSAVQGLALSGADRVNNIHFLPVAIYHKTGLFGLVYLIFLFTVISFLFIFDVRRKNNDKILLFLYMYIYMALFYSISASNYFVANPMISLTIGYLFGYKRFFNKEN